MASCCTWDKCELFLPVWVVSPTQTSITSATLLFLLFFRRASLAFSSSPHFLDHISPSSQSGLPLVIHKPVQMSPAQAFPGYSYQSGQIERRFRQFWSFIRVSPSALEWKSWEWRHYFTHPSLLDIKDKHCQVEDICWVNEFQSDSASPSPW